MHLLKLRMCVAWVVLCLASSSALGQSYVNQAVLVPEGGTDGLSYGRSVALDGDVAFVGDPSDSTVPYDLAAQGGAVYVFERTGDHWSQVQKLVPPGDDRALGWRVAVQGSTAVVSAISCPTDPEKHRGCVIVYTREGGSWVRTQELGPLLPSIDSEFSWIADDFGWDLALDGDRLAVGAPRTRSGGRGAEGAVYMFARTGGVWAYQERLVHPDFDASVGSRSNDNRFGSSVALQGDTLVVGSPGDSERAVQSGAVFILTHSGGEWSVSAKIMAERSHVRSTYNLGFGNNLDFDGRTLVVGTDLSLLRDESGDQSGAFVYRLSSPGSPERLVAPGFMRMTDVAVSEESVFVVGEGKLAWVFDFAAGGWSRSQLFDLLPDSDNTGRIPVAMDLDTALVGTQEGPVHVFVRHTETESCSSGSECPSGVCEDGLCCEGECDPEADLDAGPPDGGRADGGADAGGTPDGGASSDGGTVPGDASAPDGGSETDEGGCSIVPSAKGDAGFWMLVLLALGTRLTRRAQTAGSSERL